MNKVIITEEMRFRQRLCEYALKKGATKAARKYQVNRMFVYRHLKKYDLKYEIKYFLLKIRANSSVWLEPPAHNR